MNAAIVINMVIFFLVALLMIGIGITQLRSRRPVGFYSGEQPPKETELTDVDAWNKKHGWMWIFYGLAIILSSGIGTMMGDVVWSVFPFCGGTLIPIPVMIWYHHKLIRMYKK